MKNIFKLMGIALVSLSMMTACGGKDEEKDGKDTTPETTTPTVKVTFDGNTYSSEFASQVAATGSSQGINYTIFDFHPVATNQATQIADLIPGATVMVLSNEAGSFTSAGVDANGYLDGDVYTYEFYDATCLQDQSGNLYGDWWGKTASVEITKLDLTAKLASFTSSATMFDALDALVNGAGVENAATAEMTCEASNIALN